MEAVLTFEEARVLGCLIEKEMATPEYYPLTLNSLVSACNQKSSRDPVVAFDTATVEAALLGLREKRLATLVHLSGSRSAKHKHRVDEEFPETRKGHRALLAVLLLRGAQTAGELRTRSERLCAFPDLGAVEAALEELRTHEPEPLVEVIPAGGGRHVRTFAHLLCGAGAAAAPDGIAEVSPPGTGAASGVGTATGDIAELRAEVAQLRAELAELRAEFENRCGSSSGSS